MCEVDSMCLKKEMSSKKSWKINEKQPIFLLVVYRAQFKQPIFLCVILRIGMDKQTTLQNLVSTGVSSSKVWNPGRLTRVHIGESLFP